MSSGHIYCMFTEFAGQAAEYSTGSIAHRAYTLCAIQAHQVEYTYCFSYRLLRLLTG